MKMLELLDITACDVPDVTAIHIQIVNVKDLILRQSNISSGIFWDILHYCKKIETLDISLCSSLNEYCVENINMLNLQHLKLAYLTNLSNKAIFNVIHSCHQLSLLNVMGCLNISLEKLRCIKQKFQLVKIKHDISLI